jgi:predicted transcriptional regulator
MNKTSLSPRLPFSIYWRKVMRAKHIKVGMKSWKENKRELQATVHQAEQRAPFPAEEALYFTDLETFRKCLTPKRLELLWTVADKHPHSVRELAAWVKREPKNVSEDWSTCVRSGWSSFVLVLLTAMPTPL